MKVKFVKNSKATIDFRKWELVTSEDVRKLINASMSDLIKIACEYGLEIDFQYIGSATTKAEQEKTNVKPLALRVTVPLGSSDMVGPEWDLDLAESLRSEIDNLDGSYSYNDAGILQAWRDELNSLVEEIDAQLERLKNNGDA